MIAYNSVTLNNNDCYNFAGVPGGGGGAYQNAYSPSRKVLHNVCHNCTIGMYSDIGQPDSMDIEDNWFSVLYQDICLTGSGAPITNVTLRGNVFVETYGQALTLGTSNTPQVANITISNNRFVLDYKPNSDKRLLVLANASDVSVMDNVVQTTAPGLGQYIAGTTSNTDLSTVVWKNNRYRGGPQISPLPGMATN
jgi:hypothetical protein